MRIFEISDSANLKETNSYVLVFHAEAFGLPDDQDFLLSIFSDLLRKFQKKRSLEK